MMDGMDSMMANGSMGMHHFLYMWLYPTIVGMLFFAALILLLYWLFNRRLPGIRLKESPDEILKMRLAKGEITKPQYTRMRRLLHGDR